MNNSILTFFTKIPGFLNMCMRTFDSSSFAWGGEG